MQYTGSLIIINFDNKNMSNYNIIIPIPIYNFVWLCSPQGQEPLPPSLNSNQEQKPVEVSQGIEINLTVEDLQEAGYHNDRTPWAEQQDAKLLSLADKNELTWNQIAEFMNNRTAKMCYSRYRRLSSQTKQPWSTSDDRLIREFVAEHGQDWSKLSLRLPGRTPKQIEQHYNYCLRPEINRGEWNVEEDMELINLMRKYGKNWRALEERMNGRTQQQIKNRYFGRLKKLDERKASKAEKPEALQK